MTDLDTRVANLLRSATADLSSDSAALVAAGTARGLRARRRRRAGTTFTALVVVGTVAAGLTLSGGRPGTASDVSAATSRPSTVPTVASVTRRMAVRPARMAEVLASLLPGVTTDPEVWHHDDLRAARVLLDGAQVSVVVQRRPAAGPGSVLPCEEAPPMAACGRLDEGDFGWGFDSYPEPGADGSRILSSASTLYTADGFTITATAYNAPGEKGVEPVMDAPVLGSNQLADIVGSDVWLTAP